MTKTPRSKCPAPTLCGNMLLKLQYCSPFHAHDSLMNAGMSLYQITFQCLGNNDLGQLNKSNSSFIALQRSGLKIKLKWQSLYAHVLHRVHLVYHCSLAAVSAGLSASSLFNLLAALSSPSSTAALVSILPTLPCRADRITLSSPYTHRVNVNVHIHHTLFRIILITSFEGDCLPLRTDIWSWKISCSTDVHLFALLIPPIQHYLYWFGIPFQLWSIKPRRGVLFSVLQQSN